MAAEYEIVERAKRVSNMIALGDRIPWGSDSKLIDELAATIVALAEALEPFAKHSFIFNRDGISMDGLNVEHLRRARSALARLKGDST